MSRPTALITGASSGIGSAIATRFAQEGYNIVITYNTNEEGARHVLTHLFEAGVRAIGIQADLTIDADAKRVVTQTLKEFGAIDILVNNAGRYIDSDDWNGDALVWEQSIKQNLMSVLSMSKYASEHFIAQKSGVIINIGTRYTVSGQYDAITYAAAKAGVVNVTQSYAKLLAPFGRANCISPGAVRAGYWLKAPHEELTATMLSNPLQKLVEPEEIAELAFFLASKNAVSITGQNIMIDNGDGLL